MKDSIIESIIIRMQELIKDDYIKNKDEIKVLEEDIKNLLNKEN